LRAAEGRRDRRRRPQIVATDRRLQPTASAATFAHERRSTATADADRDRETIDRERQSPTGCRF
jgi:hypothetical protein